jgi:hypothetical protein
MSAPDFQFTTIFNDARQRAEMEASWRAAGFDGKRVAFRFFDNRDGNRHEPYSAFAQAARESRARWLVYCHQDVRADRGHGYHRLVGALEELGQRDPDWAVAGNAGMSAKHRFVARLHQPTPIPWWKGALPHPVHSLDENFFVVNGRDNACWSEELAGFHFYATDACFHGLARGRFSYVIDFHLTHLSGGRFGPEFSRAHEALVRRWTRRARVCLGYTVTGAPILLTGNCWLRPWLHHPGMRARLIRPRWQRVLGRLLPAISPRTLRDCGANAKTVPRALAFR